MYQCAEASDIIHALSRIPDVQILLEVQSGVLRESHYANVRFHLPFTTSIIFNYQVICKALADISSFDA